MPSSKHLSVPRQYILMFDLKIVDSHSTSAERDVISTVDFGEGTRMKFDTELSLNR